MLRPDWDEYYMTIAMAVRRRASCTGNRVGAILVTGGRVIATGYNGTPQGMKNCEEGGCPRCNLREQFKSGEGYDLCLCVHAEQNALLAAARFGIATAGSTMYTTMRPCFGCAKEALQAKVVQVVYLHDWRHPDVRVREAYEQLLTYFPQGCRQLVLPDPDEAWAVSTKRSTPAKTEG
jgi:dCMP deaminase